jgi:Tol biopolymer transport system component
MDDFYTHVRVSSDGSRAAMELADGTGNMDVWTWDVRRQVKTRQTFEPSPDRSPAWSPDGRELIFVSLDDGSLMRSVVRATNQGFESDPPRVFAQIPVMPVARSPFDVTADGRVLLLERTVNSAALSVVTNWRAAMTAP